MFNAYVVEVDGSTAGIIARDGRGFRFHASSRRFQTIDGAFFTGPRDAERAARALLARRAPTAHSMSRP